MSVLQADIRKQVKHYQESRDKWKQRNAEKRTKIQALMTDKKRLGERLQKEQDNMLALNKQIKCLQSSFEEVEEKSKIKDKQIDELKKKLVQ